jgi:hypothetical protein
MMTRINELPRQPMTAIVFDTFAYAEKLEAAGFTPEQAKGQAHALREIIDNQIATKQDIAALDASVTATLFETKAELIKWYIGAMFAMTGLIVGLLKFVH